MRLKILGQAVRYFRSSSKHQRSKLADRAPIPFCISACCVSAKIQSFDIEKDAVQAQVARAGQRREVFDLQIHEFRSQCSKVLSIDKQAAYNEDGLVIWPRWVAKFSKVSGFVNETDFQ